MDELLFVLVWHHVPPSEKEHTGFTVNALHVGALLGEHLYIMGLHIVVMLLFIYIDLHFVYLQR